MARIIDRKIIVEMYVIIIGTAISGKTCVYATTRPVAMVIISAAISGLLIFIIIISFMNDNEPNIIIAKFTENVNNKFAIRDKINKVAEKLQKIIT